MEHFDDRSTRYALVKKVGSSTLGAALRPGARGGYPLHRFVFFVRHPLARLVSGWSDLVRHETFDLFVPKICKLTNEEMDHHFEPQIYGIQQVIDWTELEPSGRLYIGTLETLNEVGLRELEKFKGTKLYNRTQHRRRSKHDPWETYYENPLVKKVAADKFAEDYKLWQKISDMGGWYESPPTSDWKKEWKGLLSN